LFTDCSLIPDLSATTMSDMENLHHVTLDRKQDPVERAGGGHRAAGVLQSVNLDFQERAGTWREGLSASRLLF
jgi:hypothetical protein